MTLNLKMVPRASSSKPEAFTLPVRRKCTQRLETAEGGPAAEGKNVTQDNPKLLRPQDKACRLIALSARTLRYSHRHEDD